MKCRRGSADLVFTNAYILTANRQIRNNVNNFKRGGREGVAQGGRVQIIKAPPDVAPSRRMPQGK